jgi:hypothetical protein
MATLALTADILRGILCIFQTQIRQQLRGAGLVSCSDFCQGGASAS